jgi:5'-nucleotidase
MRIASVAPRWYAVSGSPADSVLVALFHLCPRPPSLVVSGINLGVNVGTDVFYSGTLAGALEAAIHDVPAIAISQEVAFADSDPDQGPTLDDLLERTADFGAITARHVLDSGLPRRTALSINAPAALRREYCWTRLGRRVYREMVEQRHDLRGHPYFWIGGPVLHGVSGPGTDAHAIEQGLISLTLLGLDMSIDPPDQYQGIVLDGYRRRRAPGTD